MRLLSRLVAAGLILTGSLSADAWGAAGFQRTLALQGIRFAVTSSGEGSQQQLTITTTGARRSIPAIHQVVNGAVVGAQVADLDGNGNPEIYVYVQGSGSGSYGELVGYAINNGLSLTPITLPELSGALSKGYQGHDRFQVVEGCLVRSFPLYRAGDTNARPSGGERQICYRLHAGEAGWILRPSSVLKF